MQHMVYRAIIRYLKKQYPGEMKGIMKRAERILPQVEELTVYYECAMTNAATKIFCRMSGKRLFTPKGIEGMKATAALRAGDRNPYSWNRHVSQNLIENGKTTTC